MSEETIKRALGAAADEVISEFDDGIVRTFEVVPKNNLQWEANFTYGNSWDFHRIPSLCIREEYGHDPDHELLKTTMRAHLMANPPKQVGG